MVGKEPTETERARANEGGRWDEVRVSERVSDPSSRITLEGHVPGTCLSWGRESIKRGLPSGVLSAAGTG